MIVYTFLFTLCIKVHILFLFYIFCCVWLTNVTLSAKWSRGCLSCWSTFCFLHGVTMWWFGCRMLTRIPQNLEATLHLPLGCVTLYCVGCLLLLHLISFIYTIWQKWEFSLAIVICISLSLLTYCSFRLVPTLKISYTCLLCSFLIENRLQLWPTMILKVEIILCGAF